MIHYALTCDDGHRFESWFKSAGAFETLERAGHLSCALCGSSKVRKAVMAPNISAGEKQPRADLARPASEAEQALAALRRHVEENADYVGDRFAEEARAMYLGGTPTRPIYGEANGKDAKALIEDGVPVAPLPFLPNRKAN